MEDKNDYYDDVYEAELAEIEKEPDPLWREIFKELHIITWKKDPDFKNMTVKELRKAASKKRTPREFVIASLARSELRRRGLNK